MNADPELSALLGDVIRSVDEDIAADPGCPDLAAVIARAHQLDPSRVSAEAVAEVNQWAPVVSIQQGYRRRRTREDEELWAVIEGVRAHVEEDVAQSLGTPPPVTGTSEPPPRRVWGYVLAAAAVLLLFGAAVLQADIWKLGDDAPGNEAPFQTQQPESKQVHEVVPRQPEPQAEPASTVVDEPPPPVEPEPAELAGAELTEVPDTKSPRSGKRVKLTLEELDAAAHAAWKAGDLSRAERLFRVLAKRAGKDRLGDLAYGDLFTLARQTRSPTKEVSLWREYLGKFPRGRFADDARSGLCRRAKGDKQVACWQRYLDEMPGGSHRSTAQRAVDAAGDAP